MPFPRGRRRRQHNTVNLIAWLLVLFCLLVSTYQRTGSLVLISSSCRSSRTATRTWSKFLSTFVFVSLLLLFLLHLASVTSPASLHSLANGCTAYQLPDSIVGTGGVVVVLRGRQADDTTLTAALAHILFWQCFCALSVWHFVLCRSCLGINFVRSPINNNNSQSSLFSDCCFARRTSPLHLSLLYFCRLIIIAITIGRIIRSASLASVRHASPRLTSNLIVHLFFF